eukprot:TRINITY_DN373_c4_g1_i1.p1 TRINITY_DN373_c4_g1~~TRINITY_DN373_c4_g1_i1.p1  ORF type:complete len:413 (+),score=125.46 TRINITY_DN373_c4_g1_i1:84-1241(+)
MEGVVLCTFDGAVASAPMGARALAGSGPHDLVLLSLGAAGARAAAAGCGGPATRSPSAMSLASSVGSSVESLRTLSSGVSSGSFRSAASAAPRLTAGEVCREYVRRVGMAVAHTIIRHTGHVPLVDADDPQAIITAALAQLHHAIRATEGVAVAVVGSAASVAWDMRGGAGEQLKAALTYVGLLHAPAGAASEQRGFDTYTGVATGAVLQGNVGTGASKARVRYAVVTGRPVALARLLADSCCALQADGLYATLAHPAPVCLYPRVRRSVRPVDEWTVESDDIYEPAESFTVYEIHPEGLAGVPPPATSRREAFGDGWGDAPSAPRQEAGGAGDAWGDPYWAAFERGDAAALADFGRDDYVAEQVAGLVRRGGHLREALPRHALS